MCWNIEASALFAVIGTSAAIYSYRKSQPAPYYTVLLYFTMMELIQFLSYFVIDDCEALSNQTLTLVAYYHICFQAFFLNYLGLCFIDETKRKKVKNYVYAFCGFITAIWFIKLYPFSSAGRCMLHEGLIYGRKLCTHSGEVHLYWTVPLNDIGSNIFPFLSKIMPAFSQSILTLQLFSMLILPILYGSWRFVLVLLLPSFLLANILASTNEVAAIWCLFSISLLGLIVCKPVQKYLHR